MRRLIVAGGGTGGHIYPLLAVLEALPAGNDAVQVLYLGAPGSMEERLAAAHGVAFHPISTGQVLGKGPLRALVNLGKVSSGVLHALQETRRFDPDVVLVTGGYVSVPAAMAGWLTRRPVVVCLPDMEPGLAVRRLAQLAQTVTVSFPEVLSTLPAGKCVVTGYPVRRALVQGDRATARRRLGVPEDERMLVVFGGSRGSRSINDALLAALPELLPLAQIYHVTGSGDYDRVRAAWQENGAGTCAGKEYRIYSYVEDEMADLLLAADLVVARAGAATLGEFPAAGVPSVLVPYPYAGGHQALNATYLVDKGAAVLVTDGDLANQLAPTVRGLLQDDARRQEMARAARSLAQPQACAAIVEVLQRAAAKRSRR